jgi:hypothetical protein
VLWLGKPQGWTINFCFIVGRHESLEWRTSGATWRSNGTGLAWICSVLIWIHLAVPVQLQSAGSLSNNSILNFAQISAMAQ